MKRYLLALCFLAAASLAPAIVTRTVELNTADDENDSLVTITRTGAGAMAFEDEATSAVLLSDFLTSASATTTPTLSQVIAQGNNTALDPVDHATTATNLDVDGDTELLQLFAADWLTSGAVAATTQTVYGMALEYMELTTTSQAIMPAPLCAPNNYSGGTIDIRAICLSGEAATIRLGYVSYGAIDDGDIAGIAVAPTWIELAVDPDTPGDVGLTGDWLTGQSLGWVAGAPFQLVIESPDAAGQPGTVGVVLLEIKYPIDHVASGE